VEVVYVRTPRNWLTLFNFPSFSYRIWHFGSRFLCLSPVFTLVSCLTYLPPCKWMQHVSPKRPLTFNGLHGVMSQKIEIFKCFLFTFFQFICSTFICSQLLTLYMPNYCEWWIGKEMVSSERGLIWGTILLYAWKNWIKLRRPPVG
jgi:hypothetical protein